MEGVPSTDLIGYYERRAPHYDAVYERPERQADLRRFERLVPSWFADRDVIEVAAGTGFWTAPTAAAARSVCATDVNAGPLAEAGRRGYPRSNVRFHRADAFALHAIEGEFTGAFAGFWWSHLRRDAVDGFLRGLCGRVGAGSPVVFVDNRYVEGSSTPIARTDADRNTYQRRLLPDGTDFEVLKNFPTPGELRQAASPHGTAVEVVELEYFWLLALRTR